jgi:hypothetical protein
MMFAKVLALGAQLVLVDTVPTLNVDQVCTGIAEQGGVTFHDSAVAQEKKDCIDSERAIREELVKQWSSFDSSDKVHCTNESTMGGESSYTELLTCLEMARDVRAMHNESKASDAGSPRARPAPPGHAQPRPK